MLEGMLEGWGGLAAAAALLVLIAGFLGARRGASEGARRPPPPTTPRARSAAEAVEQPARGAEPARSGAAAEALLRVVRDELQRGHNEAAVAHWLALGAAGLDAHADPALAIRMATLLRDGGRSEEAAAALRGALRRPDAATGPATAIRVARAASEIDPGLAVEAASRALAAPELDPLDRHDLERLLAKLQRGAGVEPGEDAPAPVAESPEPAEQPAAGGPAAPRVRPEPIELGHAPRRLEVVLASPVAVEPAGLRVALGRGIERVVGWREFDAVAVGAVEGLGAKPVLVVDLVAGWRRPAEEPLRIVRLRGDRFDPRKVAPGPSSPVDAFRELVDRLLAESGADPLPDLRAARGRPFAGFRDLAAFEEDVLAAEEGGSSAKSA